MLILDKFFLILEVPKPGFLVDMIRDRLYTIIGII